MEINDECMRKCIEDGFRRLDGFIEMAARELGTLRRDIRMLNDGTDTTIPEKR